MTENNIGARIRALRGKILTQQRLADLAGISVDVVRKLEQGSRQTASIGSLQKIARALDMDLADLLGKSTSFPSTDPNTGVVAIRRALTPVDDLLGEVMIESEALTVTDAKRAVDYSWSAYWAGRYELLVGTLPASLMQLRATMLSASADERATTCELLARAYWVTGCTLVHLGHSDPAFLAIRQALIAAERGNDELLAATLRGSVSWQLLSQGRYEEARRIALKTAETIEPVGTVTPMHLSAYGSLVLTGATAAGRNQQVQEEKNLVAAAREVASRIGEDRRDYETYFGPSQVVMQTVDVGVVTEDYAAALRSAKEMPSVVGLPLASRARHLADQALAHARLGNCQRALDILLATERVAPNWIKYQTLPRRIVSELLDHDRRTPLRNLARRLGVRD